MEEFVYVEPAGPQRGPFAVWGLAQNPPLQTASESGWNVPLDLYPSVPPELLDGAYVDGFPYSSVQPQPQAAAQADQPEAVTAPVVTEPETEVSAPAQRRTRKRTARKDDDA